MFGAADAKLAGIEHAQRRLGDAGDRIDCGPGHDEVITDRRSTVADCEDVTRSWASRPASPTPAARRLGGLRPHLHVLARHRLRQTRRPAPKLRLVSIISTPFKVGAGRTEDDVGLSLLNEFVVQVRATQEGEIGEARNRQLDHQRLSWFDPSLCP